MGKKFDIFDQHELIEDLSDNEAGILLKAFCAYRKDGMIPAVPRTVKMVFSLLLQMQQEQEDHRKVVADARRKAAKARWDKHPDGCKCRICNAKNANAEFAMQKMQMQNLHTFASEQPPLSTPINNTPFSQYTTYIVRPPQGAQTQKKKFIPPTEEEVRAYCQEKSLMIDSTEFVDFYQCKNWMVGKNKMADWRAAARRWAKMQHRSPGGQQEQERLKL
jgi:rubredoxin